jgi:hypothetical protein
VQRLTILVVGTTGIDAEAEVVHVRVAELCECFSVGLRKLAQRGDASRRDLEYRDCSSRLRRSVGDRCLFEDDMRIRATESE